eukprot:2299708-Rhodomonas_salina.1
MQEARKRQRQYNGGRWLVLAWPRDKTRSRIVGLHLSLTAGVECRPWPEECRVICLHARVPVHEVLRCLLRPSPCQGVCMGRCRTEVCLEA